MISTILVGYDLSTQSDQAVVRAMAIAAQHDAKLVLVHAQANDAPIDEIDNAILEQLGEVTAAVRAQEAVRLADKLTEVQAAGITAEVSVRVGAPGEVLAKLATERRAELIVVGTHGSTGITRFLLGSAAAETVRHAPCDVLVCRGTARRAAFSRPLVAMDFSPAAERALAHTVDLTVADAAIEVIHAWQLPAGSWGASLLNLQAHFPWSTVRDAVLAAVKAQADKLTERHATLARPFHIDLVQGPPASTITHAAERGGHDLIVVGTHGHRGFRRLLLGSVADGVIRHAPCSVLVVHGEHAGDTANFPRQLPG